MCVCARAGVCVRTSSSVVTRIVPVNAYLGENIPHPKDVPDKQTTSTLLCEWSLCIVSC